MVSMETGLRHEHMVPRLDLLGRNINSIVGNLWQRQEEHGSNSSNGNMSPGSGESGPGSPQEKTDESRREDDRRDDDKQDDNLHRDDPSRTDENRDDSRPSIGIRSDLLPTLPRDMLNEMSGLPALEALRRQAGHQNPFLGSLSPHGMSLTTKRPSQPPTPQSSTSGGDPSSAWSFEEQFKQLYEIDENPKRKEFLDDLFAFMQKRGSPINRLPIMAKQVLDLYELYNLVVGRGGLVEVINKKQWQEIIKGLGLPSSITSAAFTLRTQYTKYLYPLEVAQHNLSNTADLQNAIDGNKREGRRLAPYDMPHTQSSPHGHHRLPHSPTQSPPHHPGDPLAQLEMTRLALWKLYSQGQAPPPPHQLLSMPPLDHLDLRRREQERLIEEQKELMRAEEERRKEEARHRLNSEARLTGSSEDEPAEKRIRVTEDEEEEMEEEEEVELEVTRKSVPETSISLRSGEGEGKSMKMTMEVNGVLYTGILYAKPS